MKIIYLNTEYSPIELINLATEVTWLQDIQFFLRDWLDESESISVSTSGSTGTPSIIDLRKADMRTSARITNDYFGLDQSHTSALCLPAKYIAGKMMILRAIEADMNIIIEAPSSSSLESIDAAVDFIALTPMQVENTLNQNPDKLNKIQTVIIGGGPSSGALINRLQDLKCNCYQTYGMTETITHIALQTLNGSKRSDDFKVLGGFDINVDDRGCLTIKADHIYNQHVVTNDLVELINPTSFRWIGRHDNVINTGGVKVHPEIIESKIKKIIDWPFFIGGISDDRLGQAVAICIESSVSDPQLGPSILEKISPLLSKFEIPRSILIFDCFLYTETGKIRRQATLDSQ